MSEIIKPIEQSKIDANKITALPTRPNSEGLYGSALSAKDLKSRLEALALLSVDKVNEVINALHNENAAQDLKIPLTLDADTLYKFLEAFKTELGNGSFASRIRIDENHSLSYALASINSDIDHIKDVGAADIILALDPTTYILSVQLINEAGDVLHTKTVDIRTTTNGILDSAVTTEKIADRSITTNKLENSAVTSEKISTDAVTSEKIADGNVTANKLRGEAVTTEKIASRAVTLDKISDHAVSEAKLSDDLAAKVNTSFNTVKYNPNSGEITFTDFNGKEISIDLPLELLVDSGAYNDETQNIELTLANGDTIEIPVNGLLTDVNAHIENRIDTVLGDIDTALDELHGYAQSLVGGGVV